MNQTQSSITATPSARYEMGALAASTASAVEASPSAQKDIQESHQKTASHDAMRVGKEAISRRLLSRTHFAPSAIELQVRDKSSVQARTGNWWTLVDENGEATECSPNASIAAATLLNASQGDPSKALVTAIAKRDACAAMVLSNGQADTLSVTRTFIDRGQRDDVEFIVNQKLMRKDDVATVIEDALRTPDMHDFALWLCDMDRAAAEHLLARFALNGDEEGMKIFLERTGLETEIDPDDVLVDIAKMTDQSHADRISAMKLLRSVVDSDSQFMLQRQLAQGEFEVVELMVAAGVPALDTH